MEQSGALYKTYLKPEERNATHFYPNVSANDAKFYIYNLGDIYDIGDFSNKFAALIEFKNINKLRTLKIGQANVINENTGETIFYTSGKSLNISGLNYCTLLETIDMQNVILSQNGISSFSKDLSSLIYLNTLLAKGSNLNIFDFAKGANI